MARSNRAFSRETRAGSKRSLTAIRCDISHAYFKILSKIFRIGKCYSNVRSIITNFRVIITIALHLSIQSNVKTAHSYSVPVPEDYQKYHDLI